MTADRLWDALREVACSTGTRAHRIVLLHKSDVEKALALIEQQRLRGKPGCCYCGGTGVVSYTAGGSTKLDDCGCMS
jgi:hypothetical protein